MLTPRDRRPLLDSLRPPAGYRLDRAVGTSYSLDLLALLTAPLAFTFYDCEDDDGRPTSDPLALLQAIRRHADRIHLFCQAGRIIVPRPGQHLLHYLETTVIEACAPKEGGAFHPKVWVLRFVGRESDRVQYRLLCLSRNLTFDQSWDTALVLDGELLGRRTKGIVVNHPLGDFLAALPGCAIRDVPGITRAAIAQMADEIRRVRFELPDRINGVDFHPLGIPGRKPFRFSDPDRRLLIVSPFLSQGLLERLSVGRPPGILVSEPDALSVIPPTLLDRFAEVLVLRPGAEGDAISDPQSPDDDAPRATGLHAKLFVMDDGRQASLWTGSANATVAAFDRNVEFLVELRGTKGTIGIDAVLGPEADSISSFRDLLQPYPRHIAPAADAGEIELERTLDTARSVIASANFSIEVAQGTDGDGFSMTLSYAGEFPGVPLGVRVVCWPTTLRSETSAPISSGLPPPSFSPVSFEALTGFWAFEISAEVSGQSGATRFALNLPLLGAPADRRERLLRSLLKDREQVLRLLLLLLSGEDVAAGNIAQVLQGTVAGLADPGAAGGFPLLEALLRAYEHDPRRLDDIARLVADLQSTPEGRALLPEGFDAVWAPIWEAHSGSDVA
jgi:hypothetical protein